MRKRDLVAVGLVLALAVSLLLSARDAAVRESPTTALLPEQAAAASPAALRPDVASAPPAAGSPDTLPTPATDDVALVEDDPQVLPDGSYVVAGSVRNRNLAWALEIVEVPRIQVLDAAQQVIAEGEVTLEARVVPPDGSVGWSYYAPPTPDRPAIAFQRTGLRGRWVLP